MKLYIGVSIAFSVLSAAAICFIPLTNINGTQAERIAAYLIGALFWIGIVAEQISLWLMNLMRKSLERKLRRKNMPTFRDDRIGLIAFFRNNEARIVDVVLFTFVIATALLSILRIQAEWAVIACVGFTFLLFNLHCFLNGKNYKYIKFYEKYIGDKEQKENE